MLSHTSVTHVAEHIAETLVARHPDVSAATIRSVVDDVRVELETGTSHPEFLGALIDHLSRERLYELTHPTPR